MSLQAGILNTPLHIQSPELREIDDSDKSNKEGLVQMPFYAGIIIFSKKKACNGR